MFYFTYIFVHLIHESGIDFTDVLLAAFTHADPKSTKGQSSHQSPFGLQGSELEKAAHKMLTKLTP